MAYPNRPMPAWQMALVQFWQEQGLDPSTVPGEPPVWLTIDRFGVKFEPLPDGTGLMISLSPGLLASHIEEQDRQLQRILRKALGYALRARILVTVDRSRRSALPLQLMAACTPPHLHARAIATTVETLLQAAEDFARDLTLAGTARFPAGSPPPQVASARDDDLIFRP